MFIVLDDLHRMWGKRTDPAKWHATAGIVAVLCRIVVVPLPFPPLRVRKRVRFPLVAGPIRICKRPRDLGRIGTCPGSAKIRLAISKPRRWAIHIYFLLRCADSSLGGSGTRRQNNRHHRRYSDD